MAPSGIEWHLYFLPTSEIMMSQNLFRFAIPYTAYNLLPLVSVLGFHLFFMHLDEIYLDQGFLVGFQFRTLCSIKYTVVTLIENRNT